MSLRKIVSKKTGKSSTLEKKSARDDAASFSDKDDAVVFCKIFSDMIVERLCLLRRKELHAVEDLSCRGCIMDSLMKRKYSFMKSIVLIARKGDGDMLTTEVPGEGQQYDDLGWPQYPAESAPRRLETGRGRAAGRGERSRRNNL